MRELVEEELERRDLSFMVCKIVLVSFNGHGSESELGVGLGSFILANHNSSQNEHVEDEEAVAPAHKTEPCFPFSGAVFLNSISANLVSVQVTRDARHQERKLEQEVHCVNYDEANKEVGGKLARFTATVLVFLA